jgi:hypothetical protein
MNIFYKTIKNDKKRMPDWANYLIALGQWTYEKRISEPGVQYRVCVSTPADTYTEALVCLGIINASMKHLCTDDSENELLNWLEEVDPGKEHILLQKKDSKGGVKNLLFKGIQTIGEMDFLVLKGKNATTKHTALTELHPVSNMDVIRYVEGGQGQTKKQTNRKIGRKTKIDDEFFQDVFKSHSNRSTWYGDQHLDYFIFTLKNNISKELNEEIFYSDREESKGTLQELLRCDAFCKTNESYFGGIYSESTVDDLLEFNEEILENTITIFGNPKSYCDFNDFEHLKHSNQLILLDRTNRHFVDAIQIFTQCQMRGEGTPVAISELLSPEVESIPAGIELAILRVAL